MNQHLRGGGNYLNEGGIGVALFLILSGAVLITNYGNELKIGQFFKKRVIRIFIPLCISYVIMFIILCILFNNTWENVNKLGLLFSLFGLEFFSGAGLPTFWLVGEWFNTIIIIMYIIFPLLRLMLKKIPIISTILITCIFVANVHFKILTYGGGWFSITNSLMVFWIGMIIGYYKPKYKYEMFVAGIIGIIPVIIFAQSINSCMFYLLTLLFSTFLFMIMGVINYSNKLTDFISKYNFEIYLLHHRILIWLLPLLAASFTSTIKELFIFVVLFWFICGCSKLLNITVLQINKFRSFFSSDNFRVSN